MSSKWYVEFLIVVVMIVVAIIFALNLDFTSAPKPVSSTAVDKYGAPVAASPEKQRWTDGRTLFRSHCASCHNIKYDGVGPPLKDCASHWKAAGSYKGKSGEQWMNIWIRNWHDVVDAGYKYGIDMANSRPAQMNIFVELTDQQIADIMFYVESPDMNANATGAKK